MLLCPSTAALRHALPTCASRQLPCELFYAIQEATSSLPRGCNGSRSLIIAGSRRHVTTGSDESQSATRSQLAKAPYRILFAGADRFSCTSLELLAKQDKSLVQELSVLVPPDKRTSRGLKQVHRPPLRILAESLGLQVHEIPPAGLRDFTLPPTFTSSALNTPDSDGVEAHNLLVTASFGYLIPQSVLSHFPPLNTLNVHPSLLPKYRGAAPIQWAIMHGDKDTGVTIQSLGKKFDEGRILAQETATLGDVDYLTAEAQLAEVGAQLLVDTLKDLPKRQQESTPQDSSKATFARKLSSEDAKVNWEGSTALQIVRKRRAIGHQYPLWTTVNGKRVQLLDVEEASAPQKVLDLRTTVGLGYFDKKNKLILVHCEDDTWLAVKSLKTEGRKAITADQWWIGIAKQAKTIQFGHNSVECHFATMCGSSVLSTTHWRYSGQTCIKRG